MKIKKLSDCARELMDVLLDEFSESSVGCESDLISKIRECASGVYFIPFLEDFVFYLKSFNKSINSKYFLKILLSNEQSLFQRDVLGEVGTSYNYKKEEIFFLDKSKDIFIVKGVIFTILDDLNLDGVKDFILKKVLYKYPEGGPDDVVYIHDFIDGYELIKSLSLEFDKISKDELLIKSLKNVRCNR